MILNPKVMKEDNTPHIETSFKDDKEELFTN